MWQMSSWLEYKKLGATKKNITDDKMQDKITKYVLDNEGERRWYWCSKKLDKRIGKYPK